MLLIFLLIRLLTTSTLFPYTTLFRSSAVSDKLLDLVGLGGKSAADKGKDTRDYLAADLPPSPTKSDRKSGSAGMPRPSSYAVFCLKKKNNPHDTRLETRHRLHRRIRI